MAEKLHNLSASGDVVGVSQLIQTLDVNTPNKRKWTALHFAARFGTVLLAIFCFVSST